MPQQLAAVELLPLIFLLRSIKRSLFEVELVGRFQQLKGKLIRKIGRTLEYTLIHSCQSDHRCWA